MSKVFLSHSSKDRPFVEDTLIPLLHRHGIETWYAKDDIQTAEEWESCIKAALTECDWFVVVMGPNAVASEWVKDEVHWAIANRRRRLIPVVIDECNPLAIHIRLPRIQHVDFRQNIDDASLRLISAFRLRNELEDAIKHRSNGAHSRVPVVTATADNWKPKTARIGLSCGVLTRGIDGIELSERYINALCEEGRVFATDKLDMFLENGWSEFVIIVGLKGKNPSVPVQIDDYAEVLKGIAMPLTRHLVDIAVNTRLLSEGDGGALTPNDELEQELWEMSYGLEKPAEVRRFVVGAYVELINARLLLYNRDAAKYCHVLSLFLYLVFETRHAEVLEHALRQVRKRKSKGRRRTSR
jgi:TIR domain-containing protein